MTSPLDFVTNFLKQPYPTMGLAPSAAVTKTGGTRIQQGTGASKVGQTNDSMWARISQAVPFGWTLGGLISVPTAAATATQAVKTKVEEGAQAVDGKVKSISSTVSLGLASLGSTLKWTIVAIAVVATVFFLAQAKSLFRTN